MSAGKAYDGVIITGRESETGVYATIWAGEFHGVIGDGRIPDLLSSVQAVGTWWPHTVTVTRQGQAVQTALVIDARAGRIIS